MNLNQIQKYLRSKNLSFDFKDGRLYKDVKRNDGAKVGCYIETTNDTLLITCTTYIRLGKSKSEIDADSILHICDMFHTMYRYFAFLVSDDGVLIMKYELPLAFVTSPEIINYMINAACSTSGSINKLADGAVVA